MPQSKRLPSAPLFVFGRRALGFAALLGAVAASAAAPAAVSDWNVVDHIPVKQFVIQSHRGAGYLAEENTLAAFDLAWFLNTWPECDLRTTKDGVIVTFNDPTFARVVRSQDPALLKKGVKDLTWDEISKLDVGSWKGEESAGRRMTRLSEAFAHMRGKPERHLYLDIKDVDLKKLAADIKDRDLEKQVVLSTNDYDMIKQWRALMPEADALMWMRGSEAQLREKIAALRAANFEGITQLQIHIFPSKTIEEALKMARADAAAIGTTIEQAKASPNEFTVSNEFILELGRELRSHNILFQCFPYSSDPAVFRRLLDLGLASFVTDYPRFAVREVGAYYDAKKVATK